MTRSFYLFGFIPLLTIYDDAEDVAEEPVEGAESDERCSCGSGKGRGGHRGSVTSESRESVGFVSEIPDDLPIQHRRETWE